MSDDVTATLEPLPGDPFRPSVRQDSCEVRARVTLDLYEALQREAAARQLSVAECVRRILHAHHERAAGRAPELVRRHDDLTSVLEQAQAERELLIAMVDLVYRGLLIRLERPSESEIEQRAEDASDAYEKWRLALERQLGDRSMDSLLALVERDTGV